MLIPTRFREELQKFHETDGVRGLLDAHASDVIKLSWRDDAVLADMDFPEDYRRELDRERVRSHSK